MPLIKYVCTSDQCAHKTSRLYRSGLEADKEVACAKCGSKAKRILSSPASSSKIMVDNGVQARAVEIDPNIMEINKERASKPTDRGD